MSLMDPVATTADDFNIGPLIVDRRGQKTQNATFGFDDGTLTTFTLDPVAAHPVTGRDLDQLPEAYRNSAAVQFIARDGSFPPAVTKGFRIADGGMGVDVISYNSRRYVLVKVPDFSIVGKVWCALGVLEDIVSVP